MEIYKELKIVNTKDDFIRFLGMLIDDSMDRSEEWENKSISDYLESIQSWVEDMEGYYENNNIEIPSNINWNFMASIFYVGKIYE